MLRNNTERVSSSARGLNILLSRWPLPPPIRSQRNGIGLDATDFSPPHARPSIARVFGTHTTVFATYVRRNRHVGIVGHGPRGGGARKTKTKKKMGFKRVRPRLYGKRIAREVRRSRCSPRRVRGSCMRCCSEIRSAVPFRAPDLGGGGHEPKVSAKRERVQSQGKSLFLLLLPPANGRI